MMPSCRSAVAALALVVAAAAQTPPPEPSFARLFEPPLGMPAMELPPGDKPTAAQFELGKQLFADPILSRDRSVSCSSCHQPQHGFATSEPLPKGIDGRHPPVHAPALINRGYGKSMRWDGRTPTLEAFVVQPIADPNEMDLPLPAALERLRADAAYGKHFAGAFADGVSERNLARALATFVRGIVAGDAPIDRFHHGDPAALTKEQRAGLWLFESKAGCWRCHSAPLFTDEEFHNTGVGVRDGEPAPGRQAHTGDAADRGRFKTPTLRGVANTAPYMHDGSLATLADVVAFYSRGGNQNANLDPHLKPLNLSAEEQGHLVAFLQSL